MKRSNSNKKTQNNNESYKNQLFSWFYYFARMHTHTPQCLKILAKEQQKKIKEQPQTLNQCWIVIKLQFFCFCFVFRCWCCEVREDQKKEQKLCCIYSILDRVWLANNIIYVCVHEVVVTLIEREVNFRCVFAMNYEGDKRNRVPYSNVWISRSMILHWFLGSNAATAKMWIKVKQHRARTTTERPTYTR